MIEISSVGNFIFRFVPSPRKKSKFGSVILIIFLHTFKVSLLLISAAPLKSHRLSKIELQLVKTVQKRMFLKWYGHQIDKRNTALCSTDLSEFCGISTCTLQTSHSQIGVNNAEISIFLTLYPPKTLNVIFSKVHFSKLALCSIDFHKLCWINACILQTFHSQISVKWVQAVLRYDYFPSFYPQKL